MPYGSGSWIPTDYSCSFSANSAFDKITDIFKTNSTYKSFQNGIYDGYTNWSKNQDQITSETKLKEKYIDKSIFESGYSSIPEKDIPIEFDDFTTVINTPTTLNLGTLSSSILSPTDYIRITFLPNDMVQFEKMPKNYLNPKWKPIGAPIPLSGCTAIAIPKKFTSNVYIRGEYKNSMSIVTEKATVVIDGDLYPEELKNDINNKNIDDLQKKIKNSKSSFTVIAGLDGLGWLSDIGNIFIGQENTNGDGDLLVVAGLYANGKNSKFGIAGGDLGFSGNMTGFGIGLAGLFNKLIDVRLLGNVFMKKKGIFNDRVWKNNGYNSIGMNAKFIFDPRSEDGLIHYHVKPIQSGNPLTGIALNNSVIWEVL